MVSTRHMTAEEREQLPDNGNRHELVRGELIRTAPTSFEHFELTGLIIYHLNAHVIPRKLGVVGGEGGFVLHRGVIFLSIDDELVGDLVLPEFRMPIGRIYTQL